MSKPFALVFFPLLLQLLGCAHPYTLDPLGEKPEMLNGIPLSTVAGTSCVFQAGYEYSTPQEMLVKVRVQNHGKTALEVDPKTFAMSGPPESIPASPLMASDPEAYVRELTTAAELLEAQAQMESFQGIDALGELKDGGSNRAIDDAKKDYRVKQSEAEKAKREAELIRKRLTTIQTAALKRTTVKPGETVEGAIVFKAAFGETGVVMIEWTAPACEAKLSFMLKK